MHGGVERSQGAEEIVRKRNHCQVFSKCTFGYCIVKPLCLQGAWMKHLLGLELAAREALSMAVVEQLIQFGPSFLKTPEVDVRTRSGLLFLP
jgi:hypothetical protein